MDLNDRKLVKYLQENARYSLKQLSEKVYLSSPAVAARIEKLQREGIITGFHAAIDLGKINYNILAFINIEMSPKEKPAFIQLIKEEPSVLECHIVSGSYTMLVKAAFQSTPDLDRFISKIQRYGSTETHVVLSTPIAPRAIMIQAGLEEEEKTQ